MYFGRVNIFILFKVNKVLFPHTCCCKKSFNDFTRHQTTLYHQNVEHTYCLFFCEVDNRIQIKVKSSSNLDYDSGIRMNNCSVRASDKGSPSLSATAKISVKIIDVNDNSPVIYNPQININVSREVQIGTIILNTIPASDMDSGENAALQYIIRKFVIDNTLFIIAFCFVFLFINDNCFFSVYDYTEIFSFI